MQRRSAEQRRPLWQYAFFYSWLVLASVGPLADELRSGRPLWLPLVLIVALAVWYALWQVVREPPTTRIPAVYLAGAGLLWLGLVAVETSFVLVGLVVFAPYCLQTLRVGVMVVVVAAGGWLLQRAAATGSVSWTDVVICALIAASGTAVVGYVSSLARVGAERKRLLDELEASQAARAAAERQAGVAAERQRLARDIHDTLAQGFTSIVMLLEAAEASLPAGDPARRHVAQALRSARDNLAESRRVVLALRPSQLGEGELLDALQRLAVRLREETGLHTDAVVTGTPRRLDPPVQTAILRVAQEALSNVRRHAAARHVSLTLSYIDDMVVLDVQDDGCGFDPRLVGAAAEQARGIGQSGMRERLEELGGTLAVESVPGEGTTVAATLPTHPAATEPAAPAPEEPAIGTTARRP